MNKGKPGRPGDEPTVPPETSGGDFELARPTRAPATTGTHEGDYELDRPSHTPAPRTPPAPPGRPAATTEQPGTPAAPGPDAPVHSAPTTPAAGAPGNEDEPRRPGIPAPAAAPAPGTGGHESPAAPAAPTPSFSGAETVAPGTPVASAAASGAPVPGGEGEPRVPGATGAGGSVSGAGGLDGSAVPAASASAPSAGEGEGRWAEGPGAGDSVGRDDADGAPGAGQAARPLHDPDPYSTPPYGEPGPWAPAPPVQHPTGTPAHGVPGGVAPSVGDGYAGGAPAHGGEASGSSPVVVAGAGAEGVSADPWGRYDPWAAAAGAPLQRADPVPMDGRRRRRRARRAVVGGALLLALVSGGIGGIVGGYLERNGGIGTVQLPQAGREDVRRDPDSVAGIAAQALPSVVTLHVSGAGAAGTGTGFVLDERGHILTNDHVVEPAGENGEITVTFHSGDTAEATVVGRDAGYDLAVVKVKGVRGLAPLPLGNSDNVRVGDPVVAIGAPFDLAGTVTAGIISARERPITAGGENGDGTDVSYVDALQTDAPINPGNSGGPLLDARGRVIGINSAIRSAGGGEDPDGGQAGSIGLGFAIPVNQGKRVAEELINTGRAVHPVIGITLDMEYGGDGARVAAEGHDGGPPVSTGGPGARAGIKAGDVITEIDGRRVHSGEELIVKTRAHRPGDRLELTLERGGEERKVSLVLGSSDGG
ncbi:trypsin-like peptidase domain-containing protein [Streptomyces sp. NPDC006967]|uniref:trypsin-like peptidase domain-containing protein n=1 Tax=Streptomyces sp. NPDC006967 TaxID=3156906 RepID=UPI0033EB4169